MCNDTLSHYMGHLRRLGKDSVPETRSHVSAHSPRVPHAATWVGPPVMRGSHGLVPALAFDFWTILSKKAGVAHTGTYKSGAWFPSKCFERKLYMWGLGPGQGSGPVLSFVLGPLSCPCGQGTARHCTHFCPYNKLGCGGTCLS